MQPTRSMAAQAWTNAPLGHRRFKEARPWDWYMGEMDVTLEEPRYPIGGTTRPRHQDQPADGSLHGIPMLPTAQPVEVGPRARLVTYKNFDEKGTQGRKRYP